MTKKKSKKSKTEGKPKVNKELEGFDIEIDAFGEIKTNYDINKINEFLNREVDDKKLRHLKKGKPKRGDQKKDSSDSRQKDSSDSHQKDSSDSRQKDSSDSHQKDSGSDREQE